MKWSSLETGCFFLCRHGKNIEKNDKKHWHDVGYLVY